MPNLYCEMFSQFLFFPDLTNRLGLMSRFSKMLRSWENSLVGRKNGTVVEARFLTKYKNLSFEYDNGQIFSVYEGNCEFRHMEEVVVGSSLEFVLTKMLKMSHFSHFLLTPWFGSFNRVKVSRFTSLHLEVLKRDSMTKWKM